MKPAAPPLGNAAGADGWDIGAAAPSPPPVEDGAGAGAEDDAAALDDARFGFHRHAQHRADRSPLPRFPHEAAIRPHVVDTGGPAVRGDPSGEPFSRREGDRALGAGETVSFAMDEVPGVRVEDQDAARVAAGEARGRADDGTYDLVVAVALRERLPDLVEDPEDFRLRVEGLSARTHHSKAPTEHVSACTLPA